MSVSAIQTPRRRNGAAHVLSSALPVIVAVALLQPADSWAGNIGNLAKARKVASEIHKANPRTLYCDCAYQKGQIDKASCGYLPRKDQKSATAVEWEHVVTNHSFGKNVVGWKKGTAEVCKTKAGKSYGGPQCAKKDAKFARMHLDLYNLWPEVAELNKLRKNYPMAQIESASKPFGQCTVKIRDGKFEPMDRAKGIVARIHLYMDQEYPGYNIVNDQNRLLFERWDAQYPVTEWECKRAARVAEIQGNENHVVRSRCKEKNLQ